MTTSLRNLLLVFFLGIALGYFLCQNGLFPSSDQTCSIPMPLIQIDPNGGLQITPGESGTSQEAITALLSYFGPQGASSKDSIKLSIDSSFSIPIIWNSDTTDIRIEYLDADGKTINCSAFKIGDGLILTDIIVLGKESGRPSEPCGPCGTTHDISEDGQSAWVGSQNPSSPKKYIVAVGSFQFLFENNNGSITLIQQCGDKTLTTESTNLGLICRDNTGQTLFILKAFTLAGNLQFSIEDANGTSPDILTSVCTVQ